MLGDDAELRAAAAGGDGRRRPAGRRPARPATRRRAVSPRAPSGGGRSSGPRSPTSSAWPTSRRSAAALSRRRRGRRSTARCGPPPAAVAQRTGGTLPTRLLVVGMGRLGGGELGYGSDADVHVRPRPAARAPTRSRPRTPRWPWSASCAGCSRMPGPGAGPRRRRRPAPRGPQRAARAHAGLATPSTTAAGRRRGRRRPCTRAVPIAGDEDLAARFAALVDPLRWPAGRPAGDGRQGDPPDQGAGGGRAAAARRGPAPAPQARPRRALGRRVDRPAAPAPARGTTSRGCAPPRRRAPSPPPAEAGLLDAAGRPGPARWRGRSRPGSATRPCCGAGGRRTRCRTTVRELDGVARIVGYPPGSAGPARRGLPARHPAGPVGRRACLLRLRAAGVDARRAVPAGRLSARMARCS